MVSNFKVCLYHNPTACKSSKEKVGWGRENFLTVLKDWLSRCNQNKTKTVTSHMTHLMCPLVLLFTISLQLVKK